MPSLKDITNRKCNTSQREFDLQPLSDIHFNADYSMDHQRTAHQPTLYGLAVVALFLLLIASINFINLRKLPGLVLTLPGEVGVWEGVGAAAVSFLIQQFLGGDISDYFVRRWVIEILVAKLGADFFADSDRLDLSLAALWERSGWLLLLGYY